MKIGKRLQYLRVTLLKKNQAELAEELKTTGNAISNYENERRGIPDTIKELLNMKFDVNIHWLETGEGSPFNRKEPYLVREVTAFTSNDIIFVDRSGELLYAKPKSTPPQKSAYPIEFGGIVNAGGESGFKIPRTIELPISMMTDIPDAYKFYIIDGMKYAPKFEDMDILITIQKNEIDLGEIVIYGNSLMKYIISNHGIRLLIEIDKDMRCIKLPANTSFNVIEHTIRS